MGLFGRDDRGESKLDESASKAKPRGKPAGDAAVPRVSVIAVQTRIEGTILGSEEVRIEGQVTGTVDVTSRLVVAEGGRVEGKIAARSVLVAGTVLGDILAAERTELGPTCRVEGNITAPRIQIHDGASIDGEVLMKKPSGWNAGSDAAGIKTSSARRTESPTTPDVSQPDAQ
jgi:cytoskeletal protein CcmA (bactofilin family)